MVLWLKIFLLHLYLRGCVVCVLSLWRWFLSRSFRTLGINITESGNIAFAQRKKCAFGRNQIEPSIPSLECIALCKNLLKGNPDILDNSKMLCTYSVIIAILGESCIEWFRYRNIIFLVTTMAYVDLIVLCHCSLLINYPSHKFQITEFLEFPHENNKDILGLSQNFKQVKG